ncbi:MAG: hypothetical protein N3F09_05825 [Bacteroidia bacterium]|nr:hypothetical protein [Bacteroidia bacterium]
MKHKKHIIKKIFRIVVPVVALTAHFLLLSFSSDKLRECKPKIVQINIYPEYLRFVLPNDIHQQLKGIHEDNGALPYGKIYNAHQKLIHNPWLSETVVFMPHPEMAIIECGQRRPFFRMQNSKGEHVYMDSSGKIFPPVKHFAARVPMASGYIHENFSRMKEFSMAQILNNPNLSAVFKASDVWKVLTALQQDSLLSEMIKNIYFDPHGNVVLIPSIGKHKVVVGKTHRLNEKLKKLSIFYKEAYLKTSSADLYTHIQLQFKNQIVCSMKESIKP